MSNDQSHTIIFKPFSCLSVDELYAILQLRSEIFVLEQNCLYQDMDGLDVQAHHLMILDPQQTLIGYARLFSAGIIYPEVAIGRIISKVHGKGIGRRVMEASISKSKSLFGEVDIRISAQSYAIVFYERFGFKVSGAPYEEDGIPHVQMLKIAKK